MTPDHTPNKRDPLQPKRVQEQEGSESSSQPQVVVETVRTIPTPDSLRHENKGTTQPNVSLAQEKGSYSPPWLNAFTGAGAAAGSLTSFVHMLQGHTGFAILMGTLSLMLAVKTMFGIFSNANVEEAEDNGNSSSQETDAPK